MTYFGQLDQKCTPDGISCTPDGISRYRDKSRPGAH